MCSRCIKLHLGLELVVSNGSYVQWSISCSLSWLLHCNILALIENIFSYDANYDSLMHLFPEYIYDKFLIDFLWTCLLLAYIAVQ